ncbi:unnamed protein product [Prorocentrum cordatum]|uniref:Uncharacterized protein n=1 Tax=Prorocentrum cordatum TaxID=2364126 RepID=A0ABN9WRR7_9DINO|nr:unnamed protein product [Polarella glacialis]
MPQRAATHPFWAAMTRKRQGEPEPHVAPLARVLVVRVAHHLGVEGPHAEEASHASHALEDHQDQQSSDNVWPEGKPAALVDDDWATDDPDGAAHSSHYQKHRRYPALVERLILSRRPDGHEA